MLFLLPIAAHAGTPAPSIDFGVPLVTDGACADLVSATASITERGVYAWGRRLGPADTALLVPAADGGLTHPALEDALRVGLEANQASVASGCATGTPLAIVLPAAEGTAEARSVWQAVALRAAEDAGYERVAVVQSQTSASWDVDWWDLPASGGLAGLVAPAEVDEGPIGPSLEDLVEAGQLVPESPAKLIQGAAQPELLRCHRAALRRDASAGGDLKLVVSIGDDRRVTDVRVHTTTLNEPGLEACAQLAVASAAASLSLTGPQDVGVAVTFTP